MRCTRLKLTALEDRSLPSFSPTAFAMGANPQAVATADFNRDGRLDLATANVSDNSVSVRLGDGQGGFDAETRFSAGVYPPGSMAVGDFNNDGNLDLALAGTGAQSYGGVVSVLLGNGDGGLRPPINRYLTSIGQPLSIAEGDFNADGMLDLAVASTYYYRYAGETYVEILLGNGAGAFTDGDRKGLPFASNLAVTVADVNADGRPDVVVANEYNALISVLLGNANGTLSYNYGASDFAAGNNARGIAVGDFTGDGIPDLLVTGYSHVAVLPGLGGGTFADRIVTLANNSYQTALGVGDFNGDGKLDAVVSDANEGTLTTLLGRGNGTFALLGDQAVGLSPMSVAIGDFNGDGRPDVVTANSASSTVAVLLNDGTWSDVSRWVEIRDLTITEGNTGTTVATFTVIRGGQTDRAESVTYVTADGTARAGTDYQSTNGTLSFAAGEISKTITVLVIGDRLSESHETFFVNLSGAASVYIADGQAVGTIIDDEPRVSIADVTLTEGGLGQRTFFVFTVTLSTAYDQSVTISFRTGNGTAKKGEDYVARSGTLTFAPGETTKTITIEVKGDTKREGNETFYLDLTDPRGTLTFTKSRGIGAILNDD